MKLNCNIVFDLLPLYLEDACSEDSKTALEEHLQDCPACREKLKKMKNDNIIPQVQKKENKNMIANYAKKVKRHRIRVGILIVLISTLAVCFFSLCILTIIDMRRQANPTVFDVEEGVFSLTAADLETTAAEVGEYVLFTNSTQIKVSIQKDINFHGQILLWNATDKTSPNVIGYGKIDLGDNSCTFTNLSASKRYMITCDGEEWMTITVSEGRDVSFWNSLKNVITELFSF